MFSPASPSPPISSPASPSSLISSPEPFVAVLLAGELVTPSPHKVIAGEADGSGKFGQAEGSAYLFDLDIYTDGRISILSLSRDSHAGRSTPRAAPQATPVRNPPQPEGTT